MEDKKAKMIYIGVRISPEIYSMIKDLAVHNKETVSKTIRKIFGYVPKLHALIPKGEK